MLHGWFVVPNLVWGAARLASDSLAWFVAGWLTVLALHGLRSLAQSLNPKSTEPPPRPSRRESLGNTLRLVAMLAAMFLGPFVFAGGFFALVPNLHAPALAVALAGTILALAGGAAVVVEAMQQRGGG